MEKPKHPGQSPGRLHSGGQKWCRAKSGAKEEKNKN